MSQKKLQLKGAAALKRLRTTDLEDQLFYQINSLDSPPFVFAAGLSRLSVAGLFPGVSQVLDLGPGLVVVVEDLVGDCELDRQLHFATVAGVVHGVVVPAT